MKFNITITLSSNCLLSSDMQSYNEYLEEHGFDIINSTLVDAPLALAYVVAKVNS